MTGRFWMVAVVEAQERRDSGWVEVVTMVEEIAQMTGWSKSEVGRRIGYAGSGIWSVMAGRTLPEKKKIQRLKHVHRMVKDGKMDQVEARPLGRSAKFVAMPPALNGNGNGKGVKPQGLDAIRADLRVALEAVGRAHASLTAESEGAPSLILEGLKVAREDARDIYNNLHKLSDYVG
jgi:hypothetical protein